MAKKAGEVLQTEHRKKNVKVIISKVRTYKLEEVGHVILSKKNYTNWLITEMVKLGLIKRKEEK